jgi:hypothetical protein
MRLRLVPQHEVPPPNQPRRASVVETLREFGFKCRPIDTDHLEVTVSDTDFWCTSSGVRERDGLRIVIRPRINGRVDRFVSPLLVAVVRANPQESYIRFLAG